eukprot:g7145.t1
MSFWGGTSENTSSNNYTSSSSSFGGGKNRIGGVSGKNKVVTQVGILVERLRNSHSLEEVQESLDGLLDLSGANPIEVGEGSFRIVVDQLNSLVENSLSESTGQIIQSLLDILYAVCRIAKNSTVEQKEAALQRSDALLKNVDNINNVLNLLERAEMWVKLGGIQLLNTLHENRKDKLEDTILGCSAGMMRLMDVLTSENVHEKVRNDMLLLLDRLTRENDRIKEFVAFQEGFERLFQIVKREKSNSIVALDCLTVVKNILNGSELTKKLFAQTPCVRELEHLCSPPKPGVGIASDPDANNTPNNDSDRNVASISVNEFRRCEMGLEILSQLLRCDIGGESGMEKKQVISALKAVKTVALLNPQTQKSVVDIRIMRYVQQSNAIRKEIIKSSSVIKSLLSIACAKSENSSSNSNSASNATNNNKNDARLELLGEKAMLELGNLLCANKVAQDALLVTDVVIPFENKEKNRNNVITQVGGVALLFSLALKNKSKQIREAAIYAITCYLQDNEGGQISIIGHAITPPPVDTIGGLPRAPVAGSILVQTLVDAVQELEEGTDRYDQILSQFWQSCRILENLCSYDPACKELLLRVPVTLGEDNAVVGAATTLFLPGYLMRALSSSLNNSNSKIHPSISLHYHVSILRFICILLNKSEAAVSSVLGSPSNLKAIFTLLDVKGGVGEDHRIRRGLGALLLAVSLETTINAKNDSLKGDEFDSDVMKLIRNGVGLERFSDLLAGLMQTNAIKSATSETYKRNNKKASVGEDEWEKSNLFDYNFRTFAAGVKESARRQLILAFTEPKTPRKNPKGDGVTNQDNDSEKVKADVQALADVLEQYKEMIRVQDKEIETLKKQVHKLKKENNKNDDNNENETAAEDTAATIDVTLSDMQSHVTFSPGKLPGETIAGNSEDANNIVSNTVNTQTSISDPVAMEDTRDKNNGDGTDSLNSDNRDSNAGKEANVKIQTLLQECNSKDKLIRTLERTIRLTAAEKINNEDEKLNPSLKDDDMAFATMEILRLHSEIAKLELELAKDEFKESLKQEKTIKDLENATTQELIIEDYEMNYKKLYLEHRDLLIVLANQEIHNNAMTDKIMSTLGESAVEEVNQIAANALQNMLDDVTRMPINPLDKQFGDRTLTSVLAEAIHGKPGLPAETVAVPENIHNQVV